jgi:hypothetical protein
MFGDVTTDVKVITPVNSSASRGFVVVSRLQLSCVLNAERLKRRLKASQHTRILYLFHCTATRKLLLGIILINMLLVFH